MVWSNLEASVNTAVRSARSAMLMAVLAMYPWRRPCMQRETVRSVLMLNVLNAVLNGSRRKDGIRFQLRTDQGKEFHMVDPCNSEAARKDPSALTVCLVQEGRHVCCTLCYVTLSRRAERRWRGNCQGAQRPADT